MNQLPQRRRGCGRLALSAASIWCSALSSVTTGASTQFRLRRNDSPGACAPAAMTGTNGKGLFIHVTIERGKVFNLLPRPDALGTDQQQERLSRCDFIGKLRHP